MRQIRYVIFDDEPYTTIYFDRTISRLRPEFQNAGCCGSVRMMKDTICRCNPDFIISGVRLCDGVSIDEFHKIGCDKPKIIFTAYPSYFDKLHGLNVVHCAVKPVPESEVEASLLKVEKIISAQKQFQESETQV
ncbi:MAG: hypothetical protein NC402_01125 [Prevotella sp.]|nr:hypothetical protein [Prevotella sp.]MCM1075464.1 hypothetical protein [Ruminococcus sp.]